MSIYLNTGDSTYLHGINFDIAVFMGVAKMMALFVFVWFVGNLSNPMKTSTIIMGQSITINVKPTRNVRITDFRGLRGRAHLFSLHFLHTFFCASVLLVHFFAVHYIFLRCIKSPLTISSNYQLKWPPIKTVYLPTNFCMCFWNCPPQALA